ncbi:hypothetical protein NCCP2495_14540 [Dietzia sp. NCCP-2495]|uniref:hypothetical protein n=1 Tax=Dietzia sp. NCCP-2495 TaxID=2934675 RepID=UPI00222EFB06|nr:hypothetical protein [Dietzia sp. NCCP-2495]GLB63575.1 hypothetical protein NCCP2495_14540 [Dietzia sp. NCCP-2495]
MREGPSHPSVLRRVLAAALGAGVLAVAAGCTDSQIVEDPTTTEEHPVTDAMTIDDPRRELDATLEEVRAVAEETLGADGWQQNPSSGAVTACDVDLYVYNAPQMSVTTVMDDDQWGQAWPRIREIIEGHGYTDGSEVPMEGSAHHVLRIANERGDTITIANVEGAGFTYGGQTACYPAADGNAANDAG